jgi:hypothetical protein
MRIGIFTFVAAFVCVLLAFPSQSRADLTITPVRVVFENRDKSAIVELLNETDHTNTYRMKWITMKAKPAGGYDTAMDADEKDPHSVAHMVIFTPRQVTIEPHGHQVIRLSLRRPADLPPGEYRAHMAMVRMADQSNPHDAQDPNAKGIEFAMNVNIGFSIPVIVRSGDDKDLKVALNAPKLAMHGKKPALDIDVDRISGKFSSYGTVQVLWQPPKGEQREIGIVNNIALYPEVQQRHLSIPLKDNPTGGSLKVVYLGKYESDGKTWAETSFPIGK